jgi:hypothetical protein
MKQIEYTPLTSIVEGNPRQECTDISQVTTGGQGRYWDPHQQRLEKDDNPAQSWDYQTPMEDFDDFLFTTRAKGHFFVFPKSVLGMASFYQAPKSVTSEEIKNFREDSRNSPVAFPTTIRMADDHGPSREYRPLFTIPDETIIGDLEMTLPEEKFKRLSDFYAKMTERQENFNPLKDTRINKYYSGRPSGLHLVRKQDEYSVYNSFGPAIGVYHNGVIIKTGDFFQLKPDDVVRIGPSIVFGYLKKE